MKKLVPAILLLFFLGGCGKKNDAPSKEDLRKGVLHYTALMVMNDLLDKGQRSDYAALLPREAQLAAHVRKAQAINQEYAQHPKQAEKHYLELLHGGLQIDGTVAVGTNFVKSQSEYIDYGRNPKTKRFYEVKLHTEFDRDFYQNETYPVIPEKAALSVICTDARSGMPTFVKETPSSRQVDIFFSGCTLTKDGVKSRMNTLVPALAGALDAVYGGQTPVSAEMASELATLYAKGESLPVDSPCRSGSHEACMPTLEKARPQGDADNRRAALAKIARLPETDEADQ